MELSRDNYYTPEADWAYMSCSQYQGFLECEAKQMAKLEGRWEEKPGEALIVGNYFHSWMESKEAHEDFCQEHFDDIYKYTVKKDGAMTLKGKYAPYQRADEMIAKVMGDDVARGFYERPGEVERIMTGELFGVPWRIRMDKYFPQTRMIIDWKTVANIWELKYNLSTRQRETFCEAYGYLMRAAVYSEIVKQNTGMQHDPVFLIIAVSKQDPPDIAALSLNHRVEWDYQLEEIRKNSYRIQEVKAHRRAAKRCGRCDYCRATSRVKRIIPYYELKPEFATMEDYDDLPEI